MALKIRLRRMGRKKAPSYRIVVAESTMPRDGRFVASIGHYNPRTEPLTLQVDRDRALFWLDQGAIPTDTAKSLLKRAGVFGPAPTVTEEAVEAVKKGAKQTTGRARAAAAAAVHAVSGAAEEVRETVAETAEDVREAVSEAAEKVRDRVSGEESEEAAASEAGAEGDAAEEEKAAPSAE